MTFRFQREKNINISLKEYKKLEIARTERGAEVVPVVTNQNSSSFPLNFQAQEQPAVLFSPALHTHGLEPSTSSTTEWEFSTLGCSFSLISVPVRVLRERFTKVFTAQLQLLTKWLLLDLSPLNLTPLQAMAPV